MTKKEKATNAVIEAASDRDLDLTDQDAETLVEEAFGAARIKEAKIREPDILILQEGRERLARMQAVRKELDEKYACSPY